MSTATPPRAPLLRLDVELRRGGFRRRVRIDSDARALALTGVSGAGKTSVLEAIAGLCTPVSGRIEVLGRVLFDQAVRIDVPPHRRSIGYVFQDLRLFPHLSVRGNLGYGARRGAPGRFGFDEVVALLGLEPLLARRTRHLSGGEARRVAIGRALLSQPSLLLLDEPLTGLDPARRDELIPWLRRLRDTGVPMLYVSHQSEEIRQLAEAVHALE